MWWTSGSSTAHRTPTGCQTSWTSSLGRCRSSERRVSVEDFTPGQRTIEIVQSLQNDYGVLACFYGSWSRIGGLWLDPDTVKSQATNVWSMLIEAGRIRLGNFATK